MRKITAILTALLVIALSVCTVFAADEMCNVKITADAAELQTGKTFVLHISLEDVKPSSGLSLVEMNLRYDLSLFSVEKVDVRYPDSWKDSSDFENWTGEIESESTGEKFYKLCVMMCNKGMGAKSGELGFDVTLKALTDGANGASLKLTDVVVADDDLNSHYPGDYSFKVEYGKGLTDISVDPDAAPTNSDVENRSDDSDAASNAESVSDTSNSGGEGGGNTTLIIVIVVVLVLLAGGAVAAFLLLKKKKEQ